MKIYDLSDGTKALISDKKFNCMSLIREGEEKPSLFTLEITDEIWEVLMSAVSQINKERP